MTRSRVALRELQAPKRWALNGGPFGSKLVQKDYVESGVPVIRGCNLSGDSRFNGTEFVFVSDEKADELLPNNAHPGDLVFTQRGTLGQIGIIPDDSTFPRYVISQSQMKLTVDRKKADPSFIYYVFKAPETIQRIHNQAFSSGVPHINLEILRSFEVELPEPPVQHRIASILSAYDDLIENNARRIKILEEMAQMLYREWFVNFRFPGHEKVPMVDSELGPIPKGWSTKTLRDVLQLEYGKALKAEERSGGRVAVYGSSGVVGFHDQKLADGPGIIVGRKGNVGSVFFSESDFWAIDTAYYVRTTLPLHFVYFNLRTQNFLNNDAAVPGLNRNQALSLPIVEPDANTLREFQRIVEPIFNLKFCLEKRNAKLRATRDLLLPKLISGEISVENIEVAAMA